VELLLFTYLIMSNRPGAEFLQDICNSHSYFGHRTNSTHFMKDVSGLVIFQQWFSFLVISLNTATHDDFIVIFAMHKVSTTGRTPAKGICRVKGQINDGVAGFAGAARCNSRDQDFGINHDCDHPGKAAVEIAEDVVELRGLGAVSGKAVKKDARANFVQQMKFFFTMSPMCISGTRRPWRMYPPASLPRAVLLLISSRRMSPVDKCTKP